MRLIVPPENPDLDGVASAYAYAEYLKQQDIQATGAKFGDIDEETEKLLEELDESISDATYYLYSTDEFTLVSASSMENVSTRIDEEKVTEIVDHVSDAMEDFSEAENEIDEDYSTASAIIAKKFFDGDAEMSPESARLLYEAINSAEEVNDNDEEIAEKLKEKF